MGIESDRLVFDYLSRVGDLAQTELPAAVRMRLVTRLREEIDRSRGRSAGGSPAAVRRVLARLGDPAEVVRQAARAQRAHERATAPPPAEPSVPPTAAPPVPAPPAPPAHPPQVAVPGGGCREPQAGPVGGTAGSPADVRPPDASFGPAGPEEPVARRAASPPASGGPDAVPGPAVGPDAPGREPAGPPDRAAAPVSGTGPTAAPEPDAAREPEVGPPWQGGWPLREMFVKRPRSAGPEAAPPSGPEPADDRPSGPRGADRVAGPDAGAAWWSGGGAPGGPGGGPAVPGTGWTGGLITGQFADLDERPGARERSAAPKPAVEPAPAVEPEPVPEAAPARRSGGFRLPVRMPFRRPAPAPVVVAEAEPARRTLPVGPLEVLAAVALVAGAVMTNYVLLAAGWLLAYACNGIGRRRARFAAAGLPGVVLLCSLLWFWGRAAGRWGARLPHGQIGTAMSADFPVIVRVAAVASALYLVWRGVLRRG